MKNVLKNKEWNHYLVQHDAHKMDQLKNYSGVTYKYIPIWIIDNYFFCFAICKGYLKISSLKQAISKLNY